MLAKKFRLPVQDFLKSGKNSDSGIVHRKNKYFYLKIKENGLGFGRFGAVVSKKVSKSSVKRNEIKRIVFGAVGSEKIHERRKKDFLIIVLPSANQLKRAEMKKELLSLMAGN